MTENLSRFAEVVLELRAHYGDEIALVRDNMAPDFEHIPVRERYEKLRRELAEMEAEIYDLPADKLLEHASADTLDSYEERCFAILDRAAFYTVLRGKGMLKDWGRAFRPQVD